jgi:hypothetical protein
MNIDNHIILHPLHLHFKVKKKNKKAAKVIVFDFDETLGSFEDLYRIWNAIDRFDDVELFNKIFNLYPEFLRYGILVILEFVYYKKRLGQCQQVFIYTNNQCKIEWVNLIIQYIHSKLPLDDNIPLFDKIIYAFKIKDKIIEPNRTTHKKTYSDFIKCSVLSKNTEICFIDDTYHSEMIHNKIYYVQPRPYYHGLSKSIILNRLFLYDLLSLDDTDKIMKQLTNNYFYKTENDKNIDILISKKIMYFIKDFFYILFPLSKTRKSSNKIGRFTRRRK